MTLSLDPYLGTTRIMAILRGRPAAETVALAGRLWDAGVTALEVPIATPDAVDSLRATVEAAAARGLVVGAGTVTTPDLARTAAAAGARYTVAPGLDLTVLAASLHAGLPHLPGVGTATEVATAVAAGCRWVKAFPAGPLGPGWAKALHGPFPDVRIVATGGLTPGDVPTYLENGAAVVALGAALADPGAADALTEYLD
ncbi:bifunctional 4-hydroxy-2-oxoglutarate aldolase/2-dehydro-3-deoxy-phosphogluconate aldolase [Cryptosporangium phraense]|uniref:Bifunctional 4-hydroxy-2-oxoglutarate aldolase/2-dehydro-3-deoxy-phosphogluconate aldolase n=1 Tax=Cryptosporangium phraense TaxID=2593070 RepID=A0A545ATT7_9ACTN|nr:bifunctional 4-hydroxy-2-oxoglutarate aldolase/2-dehydro-3-deoxy-phosphogluconate aldolase [Cryptosporangium phraense]TQS44744.1 bifunctional 4-hydroxy-2-oxoglutarate aldolase/2-dehydro-3-deoxy-phosphogluconate aldolase [Cryptosporangium phraense]